MHGVVAGLVACAVFAAGPSAFAQDAGVCGGDIGTGPEETFPAHGARGVVLDSPLRVRYTRGFFDTAAVRERASDLLRVWRTDTGETVAGHVQVIGDALVFVPGALLDALADYGAMASGGDLPPLEFMFSTGSTVDREPPTFRFDPDAVTYGATPVTDRCESPGGGYRIEVFFIPATDDGAPGDIEYLLYLTRGATVIGPRMVARVRNQTPEGVIMAFVLARSEAVSPICLVAHAIDGVGKTNTSAEPVCFDPMQGNFFEPLCSSVHQKRTPKAPLCVLALVLVVIFARSAAVASSGRARARKRRAGGL